jgi:hypothetical protein
MVQEASCQSLTTKLRARSRANQCEIYGGKKVALENISVRALRVSRTAVVPLMFRTLTLDTTALTGRTSRQSLGTWPEK